MAWYSSPIFLIIALLGLSVSVYYRLSLSQSHVVDSNISAKSIFDFTVDSIDDGNPVSLANYKGKKAYLVVNVASKCGLTNRNYAELQELYEKLR